MIEHTVWHMSPETQKQEYTISAHLTTDMLTYDRRFTGRIKGVLKDVL